MCAVEAPSEPDDIGKNFDCWLLLNVFPGEQLMDPVA